MKVRVHKVPNPESEEVVIHCMEITPEVKDIYTYVETRGAQLSGLVDGVIRLFQLKEVLYFEAVDERVFAYTKEHVYEVKMRLYEIEENYGDYCFMRCSKSIVINLMQLEGIRPALNGRFVAQLNNGEQLIINRSYVPKLKAAIKQKVGETNEAK